ncbi:hypothetical protein L195_g043742, partial [Trifolium pratense]
MSSRDITSLPFPVFGVFVKEQILRNAKLSSKLLSSISYCNQTKNLSSASFSDFSILKAFLVNIHPPKPTFLILQFQGDGVTYIWIETDPKLVVMAFKSSKIVPWEGNHCADGLANLGLSLDRLTLWHEVPQVISDSFKLNKLGKPLCRVILRE